jgi:hypothetical protein
MVCSSFFRLRGNVPTAFDNYPDGLAKLKIYKNITLRGPQGGSPQAQATRFCMGATAFIGPFGDAVAELVGIPQVGSVE